MEGENERRTQQGVQIAKFPKQHTILYIALEVQGLEDYIILGKNPLKGEIEVYGAKNSVLPILAGSLLGGVCTLKNCPRLSDVSHTLEILNGLGCKTAVNGSEIMINPRNAYSAKIEADLAEEMRSSVNFLGALVGKYGFAQLPMPGGCRLGSRPIDIHIKALSQMGVQIECENGIIYADGFPKGADITLDFPSVGATENVILAAVTAPGITTLSNAAREPEIGDLCGFLCSMGAKIHGVGSSMLRIEGVKELHDCQYEIMPDRIVAATYMCAVMSAGGSIVIHNVCRPHVESVAKVLESCGGKFRFMHNTLEITAPQKVVLPYLVRTEVYPGFPTDCQSQLMAVMAGGIGRGAIIENIFESRFKIVPELRKMGADIECSGSKAIVRGQQLHGARLNALDLRGGAALVIAALGADGESIVTGVEYIARGYQNLAQELKSIGAIVH